MRMVQFLVTVAPHLVYIYTSLHKIITKVLHSTYSNSRCSPIKSNNHHANLKLYPSRTLHSLRQTLYCLYQQNKNKISVLYISLKSPSIICACQRSPVPFQFSTDHLSFSHPSSSPEVPEATYAISGLTSIISGTPTFVQFSVHCQYITLPSESTEHLHTFDPKFPLRLLTPLQSFDNHNYDNQLPRLQPKPQRAYVTHPHSPNISFITFGNSYPTPRKNTLSTL